ncbi:MAG: acyl-CoA dehydrogenase family protein [Deltaproteobacteria bacterium]|nr:acyl-CoA dehydrogenase family protein [Deltaproteobacteria bacterium]
MAFGFTDKQDRFRKEVRDFLEREIQPHTRERSPSGDFPRDLWQKAGRFGLLGIGLPEAYGGRPGGAVMRGIIAEEMGRIDLALAFTLVPSYGTAMAVLFGGSEKQKETWIPGFISGEKLGSTGMTEPDCGSDLSHIRTRAGKEKNAYILKGEKSYVSWGTVGDVIWIFAKTDKDRHPKDMTCFLLPLDLKGIIKSSFPQMGLHEAGHSALYLEDVRVPVECRMGKEGQGLALAAKVFPHTRMILSLSALGAARISLEQAVEFTRNRAAFGKKLGQFEGISFKLAEDATSIEAARWLCYRSLWLMDQGERCIKEIAMSKWMSTEVALRTIHNALLIHGHRGYRKGLPFDRRYRDIIGFEIAEATPQILKLTICEEILGKDLRPYC